MVADQRRMISRCPLLEIEGAGTSSKTFQSNRWIMPAHTSFKSRECVVGLGRSLFALFGVAIHRANALTDLAGQVYLFVTLLGLFLPVRLERSLNLALLFHRAFRQFGLKVGDQLSLSLAFHIRSFDLCQCPK